MGGIGAGAARPDSVLTYEQQEGARVGRKLRTGRRSPAGANGLRGQGGLSRRPGGLEDLSEDLERLLGVQSQRTKRQASPGVSLLLLLALVGAGARRVQGERGGVERAHEAVEQLELKVCDGRARERPVRSLWTGMAARGERRARVKSGPANGRPGFEIMFPVAR